MFKWHHSKKQQQEQSEPIAAPPVGQASPPSSSSSSSTSNNRQMTSSTTKPEAVFRPPQPSSSSSSSHVVNGTEFYDDNDDDLNNVENRAAIEQRLKRNLFVSRSGRYKSKSRPRPALDRNSQSTAGPVSSSRSTYNTPPLPPNNATINAGSSSNETNNFVRQGGLTTTAL